MSNVAAFAAAALIVLSSLLRKSQATSGIQTIKPTRFQSLMRRCMTHADCVADAVVALRMPLGKLASWARLSMREVTGQEDAGGRDGAPTWRGRASSIFGKPQPWKLGSGGSFREEVWLGGSHLLSGTSGGDWVCASLILKRS